MLQDHVASNLEFSETCTLRNLKNSRSTQPKLMKLESLLGNDLGAIIPKGIAKICPKSKPFMQIVQAASRTTISAQEHG